jgi:hypothetical protein
MKNIFLVFIVLVLFSCHKNDSSRAFIENEININIQSAINTRKKECASEVYEKANLIADSLILIMLQSNTNIDDSKPNKPIKPTLKTNLDTFNVEPIVPKRE